MRRAQGRACCCLPSSRSGSWRRRRNNRSTTWSGLSRPPAVSTPRAALSTMPGSRCAGSLVSCGRSTEALGPRPYQTGSLLGSDPLSRARCSRPPLSWSSTCSGQRVCQDARCALEPYGTSQSFQSAVLSKCLQVCRLINRRRYMGWWPITNSQGVSVRLTLARSFLSHSHCSATKKLCPL
jgi:hypothetical protein